MSSCANLFSNNVLRVLSTFLMAIIASGCGGAPDDMPELAEASGTVTMDGKPLVGASVSFAPTSGNRGASGRTDEQGKFFLSYGGNDGCPLGGHKVSVSTREMLLDEYGGVNGMKEETVPVRYNAQTTLTATVTADSDTNVFEFALDSKGVVN